MMSGKNLFSFLFGASSLLLPSSYFWSQHKRNYVHAEKDIQQEREEEKEEERREGKEREEEEERREREEEEERRERKERGFYLTSESKKILKYGPPGGGDDILFRLRYIASYNRRLRNPNWVLERLEASRLSEITAKRESSFFTEDVTIPSLFRAYLKDYFQSGFDRGHLAPAADARDNQKGMNETFLLTNISPQVGNGFNRDYWARLESFVRHLAKRYGEVYVVTGPVYLPKKDNNDGHYYVKYRVLGSPPTVAVPTHFFKSILVEKEGNHLIASFLIPNSPIPEDAPLQNYAAPLKFLEEVSGLTFWPLLRGLSSPLSLPLQDDGQQDDKQDDGQNDKQDDNQEQKTQTTAIEKKLKLLDLCKDTQCVLPPPYDRTKSK